MSQDKRFWKGKYLMISQPEFILFYDGQCPICRREVAWLKRKNQNGRLGFQDINAVEFKPEAYAKTLAELMAEIHGVYPDGTIIKGMDVFVAAYRTVGLDWLLAPTRWPVVRQLFDGLYFLFARYRRSIGRLLATTPCQDGRCDPHM